MDNILRELEKCVEESSSNSIDNNDNTAKIIDRGMELLTQAKLTMAKKKISSSSSSSSSSGGSVVVDDDPSLVLQYCSALECGVLLSIRSSNFQQLERTIQQIQPYYYNYHHYNCTNNTKPQSQLITKKMKERRYHIIGLYLMHLLVENRLSEFHSQIEHLLAMEKQQQEEEDGIDSASTGSRSSSILQSPYIAFPVHIERQLMVGIYDEILNMSLPDASYEIFMNELVDTVKDSIADCIEVSYTTLTFEQARKIMKFQNVAELIEYIQQARDDWIIDETKQMITFQPSSSSTAATGGGGGGNNNNNVVVQTANDVPSMDWIQQSLTYATEMERIV